MSKISNYILYKLNAQTSLKTFFTSKTEIRKHEKRRCDLKTSISSYPVKDKRNNNLTRRIHITTLLILKNCNFFTQALQNLLRNAEVRELLHNFYATFSPKKSMNYSSLLFHKTWCPGITINFDIRNLTKSSK